MGYCELSFISSGLTCRTEQTVNRIGHYHGLSFFLCEGARRLHNIDLHVSKLMNTRREGRGSQNCERGEGCVYYSPKDTSESNLSKNKNTLTTCPYPKFDSMKGSATRGTLTLCSFTLISQKSGVWALAWGSLKGASYVGEVLGRPALNGSEMWGV